MGGRLGFRGGGDLEIRGVGDFWRVGEDGERELRVGVMEMGESVGDTSYSILSNIVSSNIRLG